MPYHPVDPMDAGTLLAFLFFAAVAAFGASYGIGWLRARRSLRDWARGNGWRTRWWGVAGSEDGLDFEVEYTEVGRTGRYHSGRDCTVFRVGLGSSLPAGFALRLQSGTAVWEKALGEQDVQVRDEAFDEGFLVACASDQAARRYLTAKRRQALLEASRKVFRHLTSPDTLCVRGGRFAFTAEGMVRDPRELDALLGDCLGWARALKPRPGEEERWAGLVPSRYERARHSWRRISGVLGALMGIQIAGGILLLILSKDCGSAAHLRAALKYGSLPAAAAAYLCMKVAVRGVGAAPGAALYATYALLALLMALANAGWLFGLWKLAG